MAEATKGRHTRLARWQGLCWSGGAHPSPALLLKSPPGLASPRSRGRVNPTVVRAGVTAAWPWWRPGSHSCRDKGQSGKALSSPDQMGPASTSRQPASSPLSLGSWSCRTRDESRWSRSHCRLGRWSSSSGLHLHTPTKITPSSPLPLKPMRKWRIANRGWCIWRGGVQARMARTQPQVNWLSCQDPRSREGRGCSHGPIKG